MNAVAIQKVAARLIENGHKALNVFPAVSTSEVMHNLKSEAEYYGTEYKGDYERVYPTTHINMYDSMDGNYIATY